MSSRRVASFTLGERVRAKVHEALRDGDLIVSFDGELLRVGNFTGRSFAAGEFVILEVAAVRPLRFRLEQPRRRSGGRFEATV